MAIPTIVIGLSFSATKVTLTETTGTYNVSTNPGGYGAPNDLLTDFGHYAIIRKKNVNFVPDVVLVLDSYNPLSAQQFTVTRAVDGWYEANKLNIRKWLAGTYASGQVRYYNGVVYISVVSTSNIPGASPDWTVVTDLTTIESNSSVISTILGRVTAYNGDTYWSKQIAANSQKGMCGICADDKQKARLDKIYLAVQAALVADQFGNNSDAEWNCLALINLGAK